MKDATELFLESWLNTKSSDLERIIRHRSKNLEQYGAYFNYPPRVLMQTLPKLVWEHHSHVAVTPPNRILIARNFNGRMNVRHIDELPYGSYVRCYVAPNDPYKIVAVHKDSYGYTASAPFTTAILEPHYSGGYAIKDIAPGEPVRTTVDRRQLCVACQTVEPKASCPRCGGCGSCDLANTLISARTAKVLGIQYVLVEEPKYSSTDSAENSKSIPPVLMH